MIWEYLVAEIDPGTADVGGGIEIPIDHDPRYHEKFLKQFGDQGWEPVSVLGNQSGRGGSVFLYFKRPKE